MHLAPIIRTAYHSEQEEAEDSRARLVTPKELSSLNEQSHSSQSNK